MKRYTLKKIVLMALALIQTTMSFAQSKEYLWLGDCKLIPSNGKIASTDRLVKMSMSRKWKDIPDEFINKIGGVAFIEVAAPAESFKVNTFSLDCDNTENKAYAIINGIKYDIPLDVWMLQPIVEFANDNDNVAVTLYGEGDTPIRFHGAFLDNLLGLRLLHTDMLLTCLDKSFERIQLKLVEESYGESTAQLMAQVYEFLAKMNPWIHNNQLNETAICKLPSFNREEYVLGGNEKSILMAFLATSKIIGDNSLCNKGEESLDKIASIMVDLKEIFESYIYTDFGQHISFDTISNNIAISGKPYYRFTAYLLDSVETYLNMQKNLNELWGIKDLEKDSPTIAQIRKLPKKKCSVKQKANEYFSILGELSAIDETKPIDVTGCIIIPSIHIQSVVIKRKQDVLLGLTNWLKENDSIVFNINPTVVTAAQATCQWAAFFRYAKMKNSKNWNTFVKQVKQLKYDAPDVYTPIRMERQNEQ